MSDKFDKYLERVQKLDQIAKMAQMAGLEQDEQLLIDFEVGGSRLSYANKALDRAYERCVRAVVAKQLNSATTAENIPPPPANQPFIVVGVEVETGQPVWFLEQSLCEGVTIVGMSGAGKTVAEAQLVAGLSNSAFLYAPDTKRDVFRICRAIKRNVLYIRLHDLPFNLLECPVSDAATYYGGLIEKIAPLLMSDGHTWPEAADVLAKTREVLGENEPMISINRAIGLLREIAAKNGKSKFNTFADRFSLVARALGKNANLRKGPPIFGRYAAMAIDFSGVSIQCRQTVETMFLYQTMQSRLSQGISRGVDVVACYDESVETYSKNFNSIAGSGRVRFQEIFCSQGRTFNFGRIILGQYMSQLADTVLSNTRVLIVLRLADPAEARLAVRHLGLADEYVPVIQNLPDGQGFCKGPNQRTVQIKIEFIDLGDFPSDLEISHAMADELKWVENNSVYDMSHQNGSLIDIDAATVIADFLHPVTASNDNNVQQEQVMPVVLLADWMEFMREIMADPSAASTQHGKNLKWGMYKTGRIKKELIDAGLIEITTQKTGGRPADCLVVTAKGIKSLEALASNDKK